MAIGKRRLTHKGNITLPVPNGTLEGVALRVGTLNVVTLTPEAGGGNIAGEATCAVVGSWVLPVAGGTGTKGAPVYIDGSNALTMTATSNTLFGALMEAKTTGAQNVEVMIIGN